MTTETTEIAEAEIVEEPATATIATTGPSGAHSAGVALFGTTDPVEVLTAARRAAEALTAVLEERQLYKTIRNKKHIYIEGWLMLAGMLSISTPNIWVREIHEANKRIGWEARYEARAADGRLLSSAEGECRRTEEKWADRDEHAIRSMAQTRAQSKALASALRWVVELGGFAGTPAEEMSPTNGESKPDLEHAEGHPVWDNTSDEEKLAKNWPAYKCKRKDCELGKDGQPWATWDRHHFADPTVRAKKRLVRTVAQHEKGWRLYYDPDDPAFEDKPEVRERLTQLQAEPDPAQQAGHMWLEIVATKELGDDPSERELQLIVATAELILTEIEDDADKVLTVEGAWERAEMILEEAEANESAHLSDYA